MTLSRRRLIAASAATAAIAVPGRRARAQAKAKIKIGCLTDLSGPYKDLAGPVATEALKQAVAEFGQAGQGVEVEVVQADHQNKPDVGAGIARQWFDRDGVDLIIEGANSGVALAVAGVAKEKNKVFIACAAATSDLTGKQCNANTIHWVFDTYMLSKSTGGALVKAGGDSWYFLTADYAFGHALERDATNFIKAAGGKVLGSSVYPFPETTDFSSLLLKAQSSGAKVLGLANAGTDTINSIKQSREFGLKMTVAGLLTFITDVHSVGLETAQGLVLTDSFYWDHSDATRAFSKRMQPRAPTVRCSMAQAGTYSGALHYLKTVAKAGPEKMKDGMAAVEAMKAAPAEDDCFGKSTIRVDGRCIHPSYLWQVKTPAESKYPWDYCKLLGTTPADEAFRPLNEGGCPLVKA